MLQEPGTVAQPTLQPVQQPQGDLIVQDIEDDLLDMTITPAASSGPSLACSQPCSSCSQDATYPQAKQHQVPRHEVMLALILQRTTQCICLTKILDTVTVNLLPGCLS